MVVFSSMADPVSKMIVAEGKGSLGSGGRARSGMQGAESPLGGLGAKPPRSWSINAFCVVVKAFS